LEHRASFHAAGANALERDIHLFSTAPTMWSGTQAALRCCTASTYDPLDDQGIDKPNPGRGASRATHENVKTNTSREIEL
jgi:hypothetical protein